MGCSFLKFKRRLLVARLIKSILAGLSAGVLAFGAWLVLWKLDWIDLSQMIALGIGIGAAVVVSLAVFLLLHKSNRRLSIMLDERYALQEKVQTMITFCDDEGGMLQLQREDTEHSLSKVRMRAFGFRNLWIFLLVLCVCVLPLVAGIMLDSRRDYVPPEVVVPFEVSPMQIAGIEDLIKYVADSKMEEPYKGALADALKTLLSELKLATTEPQMQAALATALTAITETTYASSSMTEILDAMWTTEETHVKALALALNTSKWTDPDWGDFAEKYEQFRTSFHPQEDAETVTGERIGWMLESVALKLDGALDASKIETTDALYASLTRLIHGSDAAEDAFEGFSSIAKSAENADVDAILAATDALFERMSEELYGVISAQKINTNVGEYVLKKLATMFGVPIPAFERPLFVKNGEDSGAEDDSDREDEDAPNGGGVGEGAVFGSDDLVLNPLTGEYVEYGTLYATYNTLMIEKLGDDKYGYTEEQKRAIEKYFALLYGGLKNEEGNGNE